MRSETPPSVNRLTVLADEIESCRACPRLVAWRESVAADKRASFADESYWGRPLPGFGDPQGRLAIVGLGARRPRATEPVACSPGTVRPIG